MSGVDDASDSRRRYKAPYSPHHQIPTVQKYREEKQNRQAEAIDGDGAVEDDSDASRSKTQRAKDAYSAYTKGDQDGTDGSEQRDVQEIREKQQQNGGADTGQDGPQSEDKQTNGDNEEEGEDNAPEDTSQMDQDASDPKQRRKQMKKKKEDRAEREVTDPVTHLPVTIHDFTSKALQEVDENDEPFGSTARTATGVSNKGKSDEQLHSERQEMEHGRQAMKKLFPPPDFDVVRKELISINKLGITVGLVGTAIILTIGFGLERLLKLEVLPNATADQEKSRWFFSLAVRLFVGLMSVGCIWALVVGVRDWMSKKMDNVWEEEVWDAHRQNQNSEAEKHETESTAWLNSLLASVWPLINPDLFTSLADMLEDVMQASLPRLVRMVSVDDIGQGSESLRILGVRWLPTGAAARSVNSDGKLKKAEDGGHKSDRTVPGEGEVENTDKKDQEGAGDDEQPGEQVAEGMEAEEGDFVNLEVAFVYRARTTSKSFQDRTKDMHLYLAFYLPGNIKLPVWVDLRGIVGTMRLRLQLAPDPPFFALCTLTFLGQPKVDLSCIPLSRKGLNLMDVPLISNFVQSAVDAAMAEYVAPKSLTLDLKDMLAGDDFKKDTIARGVLVVNIKRGFDFKEGDTGIPLIKDGSADPYVSVGWAKFGKPVFSTRVLMSEMEPVWNETAYILVTPEELNVDERLRVQLWDADRMTADDDLGRIEVDLKQIMKGKETNGKMKSRTDGFRALKAGEDMPGKLEWSVGYFSKTRLQDCQLKKQTFDTDVRSMDELKKKVDEISTNKLRETMIKGSQKKRDKDELEQQKAQELKSREDQMMITSPPPDEYPSGIFSIQIHQITGLELEKINKNKAEKDGAASDEEETGEGLPSAYCTVIVNHNKVFKTRTKPKNAKPFFNAGTERFIPDWHDAEVHVSVRDSRVHEDDPLLGIVHLSLRDVFKHQAQVNGFYPLTGGVGFGRVRISMVWRSVQLQASPEALGWALGTLEVMPSISASDVPQDLQKLKLKFHTNIGSGKMYPGKGDEGWKTRKEQSLKLAVYKRYSSCMAVQFRNNAMMGDKNSAFAVLWLKDIPDEEECQMTLPVWKGDFKRAVACAMEDCGEKVGSITVKMTFWAGLGSAHSKWASKDENLKNVVEVLDTARDNLEDQQNEKAAGIVDQDDSSSSDSDSSDDDAVAKKTKHNNPKRPDSEAQATNGASNEDSEDGGSGKTGPIDMIKDYKKNAKSTHRKHRGIMQWKVRLQNLCIRKLLLTLCRSQGQRNGPSIRSNVRSQRYPASSSITLVSLTLILRCEIKEYWCRMERPSQAYIER